MAPILNQFSFSHYNEKARWALDYKWVPHLRRSIPPGLHIPLVVALSGQTKLPVLTDKDKTIIGSGQIIDYLEQNYPKNPLYPEDQHLREEALRVQSWFDDELGPAVRRASFSDLFFDPIYLSRVFAPANGFGRCIYLGSYPLLVGTLSFNERITPSSAEKARRVTTQALDRVAARSGDYLVGDAFSVADLTAAALLALAVLPPEFVYPGRYPEPAVVKKWIARWAAHPGAEWVRLMFARHRGASQEIRGQRVATPKIA